MKPIQEILILLNKELIICGPKIKSMAKVPLYYNEMLGDTSFLLAGLLESFLKKYYDDWAREKWIDDSLITNVIMQNNKAMINGVMIWGKVDTTEQWTDPFYFEMELVINETDAQKFIFWFCDFDNPGIPYEAFRKNRDYWSGTIRRWKYTIDSEHDHW